MATLTGQTVASTYDLLLKVNTGGIDGTLRTIQDGVAADSALELSTGAVKSTGTLTVDGVSTLTGAVTATGGVTGDLTGNADTATALETARTIGGVSFDGTAGIVPGTITVADTTDSTCSVALFESATGDLAPKTDGGITYNASTGTLTATNVTGSVTGNADTATALETARTIGMTGDVVWTSPSFDGSGNVTAAATIQSDSVDGTMIAMGSDAQGDILYHDGTDYARLAAGTAGHHLETGGSGANPSWVEAGPRAIDVFESDGTFTVPAGVTSVKVTVVGGGGGGESLPYDPGSLSGAAGGVAIKVVTGLVPAGTVAVTIGAGGASNSTGGTSSFGSHCSATGGEGAGGADGAGSGGDINNPDGTGNPVSGKGGGGAASPTAGVPASAGSDGVAVVEY